VLCAALYPKRKYSVRARGNGTVDPSNVAAANRCDLNDVGRVNDARDQFDGRLEIARCYSPQ
jgi:hypothetical protein